MTLFNKATSIEKVKMHNMKLNYQLKKFCFNLVFKIHLS